MLFTQVLLPSRKFRCTVYYGRAGTRGAFNSRPSGVRYTLYSHLGDSQQCHTLNTHTFHRALHEKNAAETLWCSLSVCRQGFYCTVKSRQLVRESLHRVRSLNEGKVQPRSRSNLTGKWKSFPVRGITSKCLNWHPGWLTVTIKESRAFFFPFIYYLNHKMICCLHQTNLCLLQGLLCTSSCDAARVSRVLRLCHFPDSTRERFPSYQNERPFKLHLTHMISELSWFFFLNGKKMLALPILAFLNLGVAELFRLGCSFAGLLGPTRPYKQVYT